MLYSRSFRHLILIGLILSGLPISSVNAALVSQQYEVTVNSVSNSTIYTPSVAVSDVFNMTFSFDDAGTALHEFDGSLNITQTYNLSDFPEYSLLSDFSLDVNPLLPDPFLFSDPHNFDLNYDWYYIKPGATPDQTLEVFEAKHLQLGADEFTFLSWNLFMFYQPSSSIGDGVFWINQQARGVNQEMQISFNFTKVPSAPELGAVPIPAAAWLFGTALIGLVGFSRRKKAA